MRTLIKAGVLIIALSSTALADSDRWQPRQTQQYRSDRHAVAAPELDPDKILQGVALLAATLLVLVHRTKGA